MNDPVTWGAVFIVGSGIIAWLVNKLWRAYRHEQAGHKGTASQLLRLIDGLDKEIKQRERDDRERYEKATEDAHNRHEEVLVTLGELAAAIAELRGRVA